MGVIHFNDFLNQYRVDDFLVVKNDTKQYSGNIIFNYGKELYTPTIQPPTSSTWRF